MNQLMILQQALTSAAAGVSTRQATPIHAPIRHMPMLGPAGSEKLLSIIFTLNEQGADGSQLLELTIVSHAGSPWPWSLYGAASLAASSGWAVASALSAYVPSMTKAPATGEGLGPLKVEAATSRERDADEDEDESLLLDMADVLGPSGQGSAEDYLSEASTSHSSGMRLRFDRVPTSMEKEQLKRQSGACHECRASLEPSSLRLCHYTGCLYCSECLKNGHLAIIPGSVVGGWDFTPRPVCCSAYEYLTSIKEQPMIPVISLNVSLLQKVPLLGELTKVRRSILANIARVNRDVSGKGEEMTAVAALRREAGEATPTRSYLLKNEAQDVWSLAHLIEIHAVSSASTLQNLSAYVFASNFLPKWLHRMNADTEQMCRGL